MYRHLFSKPEAKTRFNPFKSSFSLNYLSASAWRVSMRLSSTYTMWFSINFLQPLKSTKRSRTERSRRNNEGSGKWNYNFLYALQFKERRTTSAWNEYWFWGIGNKIRLIFDSRSHSRVTPFSTLRAQTISFCRFPIKAFYIAISENYF